MRALVALAVPLWAWLGVELLLSAALWSFYRLLSRHLASAAERFLLLKLLFIALVILPFAPAGLPTLWSGPAALPWQVLLPAAGPAAGPAAAATAPSEARFLGGVAVVGGGLYLGWVAYCLGRLLVAAQRLRQLVQSAEGVAAPVPMLLHDGELAPATVGLLRPRVLMPRRLYQTLSQREVHLIVSHEAVHLRRHDPLFNALVVLLRDILLFSPFVRGLARHFESEMELSVDAQVLSQSDTTAPEYGRLLLALATAPYPAAASVGSGLFVARSLIARRISAMAKPVSGKSRKTVLFATFVVLVGVCGAGISTLRLSPTAWAQAPESAKPAASQPAAASLQVFLVASGGSRSVVQEDGTPLGLSPTPILTGEDLDGAQLLTSESPSVSIHLKPAAAARFAAFTGSHLGQRMAILLEGKLLVAPVIKSKIDGRTIMLTGQFPDAMRRLTETINAGRPAATPGR